jgi:L-iditol 2-dehydrogenase
MKAVVARGPQDFSYRDVAEPRMPVGGRLLAVEATGLCAADRMLWSGTGPWELSWPFIPGHEILARDVASGERLAVEVSIPCGRCDLCGQGRTNLCRRARHLGSALPGGFAERLALPPQARVHPVPDDIPRAAAVLTEPLACAVHAVNRAAVEPGDTVAVVGLGAVGALAVVVARARGARRVLAVVRTPAKAELARSLGGEPVPAEEPLDCAADAVIECSGDPATAETALRAAAPGGRVCLYSVYPAPATVDLNLISEFKELIVVGGHLAPGCFPEAITLLSSLPTELHAEELTLADFGRAVRDRPARVKVALVP